MAFEIEPKRQITAALRGRTNLTQIENFHSEI